MLRGETTRRSDLDPRRGLLHYERTGRSDCAGSRTRGGILDGSDLRKPHATPMEGLQPVLRLEGQGTVQ